MMAAKQMALIALLCGSSLASASQGANPIRKVVTLLQDMQKEIEVEGAKEKDLFDKFMCFCQGSNAEMEKGISDGQAKVEELTGKLSADQAEKAQLEIDIVAHKKEKASAVEDLSKATALREKESNEYDRSATDLKANIAAMGGAIPSLEKGMGAAALVQLPGVGSTLRRLANSFSLGSDYERSKIASFLEQSGDYVPQSGQIVGILKSMKDEMEGSLEKATQEEKASAEGYGELKASKDEQVAAATEAIKTKTARVGALAVTVVQVQDDIEDTDKEVADTQKFLQGLQVACPSKEKEWDERSKMRAEEIQAISEAINILNDDDALDVFKKAVPSALLQNPEGNHRYGFLSVRSNSAARVQRAQALLAGIANNRVHTPIMKIALYMTRSKLTMQAKLHGDVFANVTGMIDNMVVLEGKEQEGDDKQKPWCNGEFEKEDREEKGEKADISSLEAEMEMEADAIDTLEEEIKTLQGEVEALDKSVAQATEQRKEEHAEYQQTVQLTQTAVELVGKAKNRLQKFYNPTLHKAAPKREMSMEEKILAGGFFAQVAPPVMPETFGAYEKKGEKSGGVMALMDQISKELQASISDLEYAEKTSQKDYVGLMGDSQATRAQDVKSITDKLNTKAEVTSKKTMAKEAELADLKDLKNIHEYVTELHGSCDFILENYGIRKEARTAEIESLKNAKAMLSGATGLGHSG